MTQTAQLTERERLSNYKTVARTLPPTHNPKFASALRKIAIGACIAQYGGLDAIDNSAKDLKLTVKKMLFATQQVQNWFVNNRATDGSFAEAFLKEFDGDRVFLLSELLEASWSFSSEALEEIISQLRGESGVSDVRIVESPDTKRTADMAELCEMLVEVKDFDAIKLNLKLIIQNQLNKEVV